MMYFGRLMMYFGQPFLQLLAMKYGLLFVVVDFFQSVLQISTTND